MKAGDLVKIKNWGVTDMYLILGITKSKKTWHRRIMMYNTKTNRKIELEWDRRDMLELVNEC